MSLREKSTRFYINGKPMLEPDEEPGFSYSDLDAEDSGRDESGVMHRIVARYKVGTWNFVYSILDEEDMRYMESIFPNAPDFTFTHPSRTDSSVQAADKCYRSNYSVVWKSPSMGVWRNYKFNIVEC